MDGLIYIESINPSTTEPLYTEAVKLVDCGNPKC